MKSKVTFNVLNLAVLALLLSSSLSSCGSSDSDSDPVSSSTSSSTSEEESVSLSISAVIKSSTEARKADYDATDFEAGDEIGVFILADDLESGYSSSSAKDYNVKATYDGDSWTLSQDVPLSTDKAYVIAYYPYKSSFGNNLPVDGSYIPLYIGDDNEQTDVLYSSAVSVSSSSPKASLSFTHALSRLTMNFALSGQTETASLQSVSLGSGTTMPIYALLGLSGSAFSVYSDSDYTTAEGITNTCDATLSTESTYTLDFLIHPDSPATLETTLVIDNETYTADLSYSGGWQSGYQYNYDISVVVTEEDILLEVSSPSVISSWVNVSSSEEIEITYQEDNATTINGYEAVDLGLSVKWATCNVGAESPEEYGNYYAWGETKTKNKYNKSTSVTYGVTMDDISGDAEYDAATANWGEPWRMPTKAEIKKLLANCTWEWTTLNSIRGYLVTADNGNSIFLPAAGESQGWEGSWGKYWSSTPDTSSTSCASYLIFYYGEHWVTDDDDASRYIGRTVRPVTDK